MTSRSAEHVAATDPSRHPDPSFPRLHGRPSRGWLNDPHGCIKVDGRYHVFFQYNPDRPEHVDIKWGHMSSTDLVSWDEEPLALFNRPGEFDADGCWTGCIVDDHGTPTAVYSAVAGDERSAVVLLARSDRTLRRWRQTRHPAQGAPADPAVTHARDPFVFEVDGHRFALQGAGHSDRPGAARVLVFGCDDLADWTELGSLLSAEDPVAAAVAPADLWECPNLVRLGDRWVLLVSRWHRTDRTLDVRYLVGDLEGTAEGPRFRPAAGGLVDHGPSFYAPQVMRDGERTLLWGWAREHGRSDAEIADAGWAGTLTFCRALRLAGDALVSAPVVELDALRARPLDIVPDRPFAAAAFDIELPCDAGLWLVDGGQERLVVELTIPDSPLTPPRIFVDGSIVEAFDGGAASFTTRAYPTASSRWLLRLVRPAPLSAWTLGT